MLHTWSSRMPIGLYNMVGLGYFLWAGKSEPGENTHKLIEIHIEVGVIL